MTPLFSLCRDEISPDEPERKATVSPTPLTVSPDVERHSIPSLPPSQRARVLKLYSLVFPLFILRIYRRRMPWIRGGAGGEGAKEAFASGENFMGVVNFV